MILGVVIEVTKQEAVSISDDIERYAALGLLDLLLKERTTGKNIAWASSSYEQHGKGFNPEDEITSNKITGKHAGLIQARAEKAKEEKAALTKSYAEVFTPTWICKMMIDAADEEWIESWRQSNEPKDGESEWRAYVESNRLEITCGEAPFLVNRYDASSGEIVSTGDRVGILGRKLSLVSDNADSRDEWMQWTIKALQSTYGYEFQGDNLLIARMNVLGSVEDFANGRGYFPFSDNEYKAFIDVITWNLWQMDGLEYVIPFKEALEGKKEDDQLSLFDLDDYGSNDEQLPLDPSWNWEQAYIKNWKTGEEIKFGSIRRGGSGMKFDYIIGNPPYQEEQEGDNANFAPPIYNKFMDGAYELSDKVELITPARFLFNAGSTPKAWNKKMLSDPHLKVLLYEASSAKVFPNTDIKGGVAITYRGADRDFGAIETFTAFPELTSIYRKAGAKKVQESLSSIIFTQIKFDLRELYKDHPEYESIIGSNGKDKRFRNNIFDKLDVFHDDRSNDDIEIIGIQKNQRVWKCIEKKYVDLSHECLDFWKVLVPAANGSGALGEVLSTPLIGAPLIGFTQSFIAVGAFKNRMEAEACLKYIKSKFARTLLGILKITQHNDRPVWKYVPLQDFTSSSDIDWSKSVEEIDVQLYKKYGLSDDEIEFIEAHVKAMD